MAPPSDHASFRLQLQKGQYFVLQFKPDEQIPPDLLRRVGTAGGASGFFSLTRTSEEVSVVCDALNEPPVAGGATAPSWKCIKIAGPMAFGVTGVVCDFTTPLKAAKIPIFALSTWNTDYILIPLDKADKAVEVLEGDGWQFDD